MQAQFESNGFLKRLKSMLKVDFKRMFTMPLIYILAGVCLILPVLILVMTGLMGSEELSAKPFTNVWQSIASLKYATLSMDITGMCNINLLYFLIMFLVCIFVAEDFRSGYAKNLFTVRSKKSDYVVSKTAVCFTGGVIMMLSYFVGAMIGGSIAGLSFDAGASGVGGIVACMFSKIFLGAVFVALALLSGAVAKQKLWLSIICSLAACMLLFTMIPMISPLDSNFLNVIMCLIGGAVFAAGLGACSGLILKKTNLV